VRTKGRWHGPAGAAQKTMAAFVGEVRRLLAPSTLRMQHKLCLWLAVLLLLGALGVGNPFLSGPACAGPADAASSSAPLVEPSAPPRVQPVALSSRSASAARDAAMQEPVGRSPRFDPLVEQGRAGRPFATPAVSLAIDASAKRPAPACPDPELQDLVIRVDYRFGKPIWVLRDGRQLWRNENVRAGEPLLVPVATADD